MFLRDFLGWILGGRSSILAANVLLDKHSACACPSPIHEEEMIDDVFPEEPDSFTQITRDEDDDLGLLMEFADIAEEEDYIQDEEQDTQDILASIQGTHFYTSYLATPQNRDSE